MEKRTITPVCAFDITDDGRAIAVNETWPAPQGEHKFRWLHFDFADPLFGAWASEHLPLLAANALSQVETRPRCDKFPGGMLLNLRGVNLNPGADVEDMVSLRMWVSESTIISARVRKIFAIDAIRQEIDAGKVPRSIEAFVSALAYGLTKRIEGISLSLAEEADEIEELAFDPKADAPAKLPSLRQSIIKMRRFVRPQAEALRLLGSGDIWPLDDVSKGFLADTVNRNQRSLEELDSTADRLSAIQDHEDAQAATALGNNTYVLSIIAAIFLPLGFLTGLFGINVGGMPLVDHANGFAIISSGCLIVGLIAIAVFRYLRWL